jgi:hypothetical protein
MRWNTCFLLILLLGNPGPGAPFFGPRPGGTGAKAVLSGNSTRDMADNPAGDPGARKVAVFYFHYTIRCGTCMRMEEYSEFAVRAGFPDELRSGMIEWRAVDVQAPENRHFMQDYRLYRSSLVIVGFKDGKQVAWRNLEKTWDLIGDLDDFVKYVQSNVRAFLSAY